MTTIANITATTDRNLYGATESNGLVDGSAYHNAVDYSRNYSLSELQQAGGKISRLRILTEYIPHARVRMADVSYCHGVLPSGEIVPVDVYITGVNFFKFKGELISLAKSEGVFAKGIGLLDESNWSVLR